MGSSWKLVPGTLVPLGTTVPSTTGAMSLVHWGETRRPSSPHPIVSARGGASASLGQLFAGEFFYRSNRGGRWSTRRRSRSAASHGSAQSARRGERTHLVARDVVGNILENLVGSGSNLGFRRRALAVNERRRRARLTVDSPEAWELIRTKGVATWVNL